MMTPLIYAVTSNEGFAQNILQLTLHDSTFEVNKGDLDNRLEFDHVNRQLPPLDRPHKCTERTSHFRILHEIEITKGRVSK